MNDYERANNVSAESNEQEIHDTSKRDVSQTGKRNGAFSLSKKFLLRPLKTVFKMMASCATSLCKT